MAKPGQRVVMRKEADAPVRLLFLLCPPVPGDGRYHEGQSGQKAKRGRRFQECSVDLVALLGLVDIGADDGNDSLVGNDWKVGAREKRRPLRGVAVHCIDDRLSGLTERAASALYSDKLTSPIVS